MATASKIINLAQAELGVCESPAGSNKVKYNTWYYGREVLGTAYPWCMAFVQWVFNKAGMPLPIKTAGCTALMNYAKSNGLWVKGNYKPGDIILYNFDNVSDADHCGICESATASTVTCIEGNTSLTSDDNGGKVMRRTRKLSLVLGAYRPKYEAEVSATTGGICKVELPILKKGSKGNSVRALQILLINNGHSCGNSGADGDFGTATHNAVISFQKANKLTQDGIVGVNTWTKLLK